MWEYIDHNKYDVSKLIVKFLSRIGYPTSAIIADEGYDRENCIFSSLGSTIDNLLTTLNQETNEVNCKWSQIPFNKLPNEYMEEYGL